MRIKLDIDATPEEMRRFMGLPDVQPLHEEIVNLVRERVREGAEGYDPYHLLAPFLASSQGNVERLQQLFWDAFGTGGKERDGDDRKKR